MPNVVQGARSAINITEDFEYEYPKGLDLHPRSKLHQKIVDKVMGFARESAMEMEKRFSSWDKVGQLISCYIDWDEEEQEVKAKDSRKPVSIVFPYSYVILETLLAYMTRIFLNQQPLFKYEGVSGEDVDGAFLLQKVIGQHCIRNKVALALHTMFRDGFGYGIGVCVPSWKQEFGNKIVGRGFEGIDVEEDVLLYEGNVLLNIDPYLFLPDTNVPIQSVQEGEFVGWVEQDSYTNLLGEENAPGSNLFNVRYLKGFTNTETTIYGEGGRKKKESGTPKNETTQLDKINMYINIIPKEWGLGDSEVPEKWFFRIGADQVLIECRPTALVHGKYPIAVCAPDFDGYSATPMSRMEVLMGLQGTLDWLFNSHTANVRKALNDMLVVDPYLVNTKDLEDPKPGKLIRLRKPAWGKGVQNAVQQLVVNDVTRGNISDSNWIVQWMQKIGAADDMMMGSLRQSGPDRLSTAEAQTTAQGAGLRLDRMAMMISVQAMQDIGYFFAAHTQQLLDEDVYIKTVGDWPQEVAQIGVQKGRMKVSPQDLLVDFDVVVHDGSMPASTGLSIWKDLFTAIGQNEVLAQQFDVVKIFEHIALGLGAKNVSEFKIKTVPDQQVLEGGMNGMSQV